MWQSGKEFICQCRRCKRHGFNSWVGKIPWRRKWQPTPVFLPGKSHEQRSLVGYQSIGLQKVGRDWAHSSESCPFQKGRKLPRPQQSWDLAQDLSASWLCLPKDSMDSFPFSLPLWEPLAPVACPPRSSVRVSLNDPLLQSHRGVSHWNFFSMKPRLTKSTRLKLNSSPTCMTTVWVGSSWHLSELPFPQFQKENWSLLWWRPCCNATLPSVLKDYLQVPPWPVSFPWSCLCQRELSHLRSCPSPGQPASSAWSPQPYEGPAPSLYSRQFWRALQPQSPPCGWLRPFLSSATQLLLQFSPVSFQFLPCTGDNPKGSPVKLLHSHLHPRVHFQTQPTDNSTPVYLPTGLPQGGKCQVPWETQLLLFAIIIIIIVLFIISTAGPAQLVWWGSLTSARKSSKWTLSLLFSPKHKVLCILFFIFWLEWPSQTDQTPSES